MWSGLANMSRCSEATSTAIVTAFRPGAKPHIPEIEISMTVVFGDIARWKMISITHNCTANDVSPGITITNSTCQNAPTHESTQLQIHSLSSLHE